MNEPMFKKTGEYVLKSTNGLNPRIIFPKDGDEIVEIPGFGFLASKNEEMFSIQLDPNNPVDADIVIVFDRGEDLVEMIELWLDGVKRRLEENAN